MRIEELEQHACNIKKAQTEGILAYLSFGVQMTTAALLDLWKEEEIKLEYEKTLIVDYPHKIFTTINDKRYFTLLSDSEFKKIKKFMEAYENE